jgi:hypothetical protein
MPIKEGLLQIELEEQLRGLSGTPSSPDVGTWFWIARDNSPSAQSRTFWLKGERKP